MAQLAFICPQSSDLPHDDLINFHYKNVHDLIISKFQPDIFIFKNMTQDEVHKQALVLRAHNIFFRQPIFVWSAENTFTSPIVDGVFHSLGDIDTFWGEWSERWKMVMRSSTPSLMLF
jgi:hypothetical protein